MDPIQPSTGSDFQGLLNAKDPIKWFFEWSINFDWSIWLENFFRRKGVSEMAMTHEDWIPIIDKYLPLLITLLEKLLGLIEKMPEPQQVKLLSWGVDKVTAVKQA